MVRCREMTSLFWEQILRDFFSIFNKRMFEIVGTVRASSPQERQISEVCRQGADGLRLQNETVAATTVTMSSWQTPLWRLHIPTYSILHSRSANQ